jgi:hypothetical protein
MVEIEVLIDYIKGARRKGFRDDFIKKGLLQKGVSEDMINESFASSGKHKRSDLRTRIGKFDDSANSITIFFNKWQRDALQKRADKEGLSFYHLIKKIVLEDTPTPNVSTKVRYDAIFSRKKTREQKDMHNIVNRRYKEKVRNERGQMAKGKRKGLFSDWKEEVESQE